MKYSEIIPQSKTITDLKRIGTIIKNDIGRTSDITEIKGILQKSRPQFTDSLRIGSQLDQILTRSSGETRLLSHIIIFEVLLNSYDYKLPYEETEKRVLEFERSLIDKSNEMSILKLANDKKNSHRFKDIELYNFVLDTAWKNNDEISPDEANLLSKLRKRLKVHINEHFILEAKLGRFPRDKNQLHTRDDIHNIRTELQKAGILFPFRDEDNACCDIIPEEIANVIKKIHNIEMRNSSYKMLLEHKHLNKKPTLCKILEVESIDYNPSKTIKELKEKVLMLVPPSVTLGGKTLKCGLTNEELKNLLDDLQLKTSVSKQEKIENIIEHFNGLRPTVAETEDKRETFYQFYGQLAGRDYPKLRAKKIIEKDRDIDSFFEQATDYLFEKKLNLTPLEMRGTDHADGTLSIGEHLLLWDNKSKENKGKDSGKINLKDFLIKQFHIYMEKAEKEVDSFLVIAPDFTDESEVEAMQYKAKYGRDVVLITAKELKELAEEWSKSRSKNDPFPLGFFNRAGRFNRAILGKF